MDRTIIDFPARYLGLAVLDLQINVRGKGGNPGVTGTGQVTYGNQPRWEGKLDTRTLHSQFVLAWRVILDRVRGRVNVLRVRLGDPFKPSLYEIGALGAGAGITHSDGATFSDGAGYAQSITAPILAAAAAGANQISCDASYVGNALDGGMFFSIDDWLYRATGVEGTGTSAVVTFEPPLRRSALAGEEINLDAVALFTLASDGEGRLPIDIRRMGASSLNIVEWVGSGRT